MSEVVQVQVSLSTRSGVVCRLCLLRPALGSRVWIFRWVSSLEAYCQDCYAYLFYQQGLDNLLLPHPMMPHVDAKDEDFCVTRFLRAEDLSARVPRFKRYWVKAEDLDGFRKLSQAIGLG